MEWPCTLTQQVPDWGTVEQMPKIRLSFNVSWWTAISHVAVVHCRCILNNKGYLSLRYAIVLFPNYQEEFGSIGSEWSGLVLWHNKFQIEVQWSRWPRSSLASTSPDGQPSAMWQWCIVGECKIIRVIWASEMLLCYFQTTIKNVVALGQNGVALF